MDSRAVRGPGALRPVRRAGCALSGEGGTVDDVSPAEVAERNRTLLAAIEAGEFTCSTAYRRRLEGAVLALETLSGGHGHE